jgi:trehalose 6-phosphate phosphatase
MDITQFLTPSSALFLDFDGTLVNIAPRPHEVQTAPELLHSLRHLHSALGGALAIVSGRTIEAIDSFLKPLQLPVAGVHGAERRTALGQVLLTAPPELAKVQQHAQALVAQHPTLYQETKRGAVALHYRLAPELEALCYQTLQAAIEERDDVMLLHGKMVWEVKSRQTHKGYALQSYMHEAPFAGRRPVFFGDDVTDEPGFIAVQALGGVGIKIGPGPSSARLRLAHPAELLQLLSQWQSTTQQELT